MRTRCPDCGEQIAEGDRIEFDLYLVDVDEVDQEHHDPEQKCPPAQAANLNTATRPINQPALTSRNSYKSGPRLGSRPALLFKSPSLATDETVSPFPVNAFNPNSTLSAQAKSGFQSSSGAVETRSNTDILALLNFPTSEIHIIEDETSFVKKDIPSSAAYSSIEVDVADVLVDSVGGNSEVVKLSGPDSEAPSQVSAKGKFPPHSLTEHSYDRE